MQGFLPWAVAIAAFVSKCRHHESGAQFVCPHFSRAGCLQSNGDAFYSTMSHVEGEHRAERSLLFAPSQGFRLAWYGWRFLTSRERDDDECEHDGALLDELHGAIQQHGTRRNVASLSRLGISSRFIFFTS